MKKKIFFVIFLMIIGGGCGYCLSIYKNNKSNKVDINTQVELESAKRDYEELVKYTETSVLYKMDYMNVYERSALYQNKSDEQVNLGEILQYVNGGELYKDIKGDLNGETDERCFHELVKASYVDDFLLVTIMHNDETRGYVLLEKIDLAISDRYKVNGHKALGTHKMVYDVYTKQANMDNRVKDAKNTVALLETKCSPKLYSQTKITIAGVIAGFGISVFMILMWYMTRENEEKDG